MTPGFFDPEVLLTNPVISELHLVVEFAFKV